MIDWPISRYPDELAEIRLSGGGRAYIFFVNNDHSYGVRKLAGGVYVAAEWGTTGMMCDREDEEHNLIPPVREVERWFIWDHADDDRPNPLYRETESQANHYIQLYGGTKVKVMISQPGDEAD